MGGERAAQGHDAEAILKVPSGSFFVLEREAVRRCGCDMEMDMDWIGFAVKGVHSI